jgi:hypothetical protein
MALITEDGTGVTGANSYIDVAFLDAWALSRNYSLVAYDTTQKEAAIQIASQDWTDLNHNFKGDALTTTQGLKMPTVDTVYDDKWRNVVAMAAYLQLRGLLLVDTAALSTAGTIESESSSLGPLSESITYAKGTAQTYSRVTTDLDKAIKPYLSFSGGIGSLVRW